MKLSVIVPAHNEEHCVEGTVRAIHDQLRVSNISHEILVINDNSSDGTEEVLRSLQKDIPTVKYVNNSPPHGYGFAVRRGLAQYTGDAVAICMADASDRPTDLVRFWEAMNESHVDCAFGTRFSPESQVIDYPRLKLVLNRCVNLFIRILFGFRYNDVTNGFKLYRRNVIDGVQPLLSPHFNLTVELPLKAIVRGYSYVVVPNDWINRKSGESKLFMREMGSRYLFIVLYCFIEKWLSKRDYHSTTVSTPSVAENARPLEKKLDV
jgi:dolichol-phosphate mannosyltransferase